MSDPVIIVSSDLITIDQLMNFLQKVGGSPQKSRPYLLGSIWSNGKDVWIFRGEHAIEGLSEDYPEILQSIKSMLNGEIETSLILEISRTEGSSRLAVDFAYKFSRHWNIVVYDDLNNKILSSEDLSILYHSDQGFW